MGRGAGWGVGVCEHSCLGIFQRRSLDVGLPTGAASRPRGVLPPRRKDRRAWTNGQIHGAFLIRVEVQCSNMLTTQPCQLASCWALAQ